MTIIVKAGETPPLIRKSHKALVQAEAAMREAIPRYGHNQTSVGLLAVDTAATKATKGQPRTVTPARQELARACGQQARLMFLNAFDHISSLRHLLGGGGEVSIFAHTTVSRAACEAAVRCAWLIDPSVSTLERLARSAVVIHNSVQDRTRGVRYGPTQELRDGFEATTTEERRAVRALIAAAGMEIGLGRSGKDATVEYPASAVKVPIQVNVTELMDTYLPATPGWYGLSSATAHSAPWTLQDAVVGDPFAADLRLTPHLLEAASAALAALDASELLIRTYGGYFGHDTGPEVRACQQRRDMLDRLTLLQAQALGLPVELGALPDVRPAS